MKLLEPLLINKLEIRNRIIMPAMETNLGNKKGEITEKLMKWYELRAKGGVGLIIVEPAYFEKRGSSTKYMLSISSDNKIEGFTKLTKLIKKYGATVLLQIYHAGAQSPSMITKCSPVSPSGVPCKLTTDQPLVLSKREIHEIIKGFTDASDRAKKASFDGVEIHAGHGYLLNQFLSEKDNKRTDEYGGSLENRARALIETLTAVKGRCGKDFIVSYRLNGNDYIERGLEVEETAKVAKMLEDTGVDLVHISAGIFDSKGYPTVPYMNYPKGVFSEYAARVKKELTRTPVAAVGRINTPEIAEEILKEGKADLVAIGRGLIADPYFVVKLKEGKRNLIRICMGCNACLNRILSMKSVACAINPNVIASDEDFKNAKGKKKVLIIGSGPGGLEAARVSKLRGHYVLLIDKGDKIGGTMHLAKVAPMKAEVENAIVFYKNILKELEVEIRLNTEFSQEIISEFKPDVAILATGSVPFIPPIKGLNQTSYYVYDEVLKGKIPDGEKIAIVGGGMVGLEVAEYLSHLNKAITIIEMLQRIGMNVYAFVGKEVIPIIEEDKNIKIFVNTKVEEIQDYKLIGVNKNGTIIKIKFDDLIIAMGAQPNCEIEQEVKNLVPEVFLIGDYKKIRKIFDAVEEGYKIALKI